MGIVYIVLASCLAPRFIFVSRPVSL